MDRRGGVLVEFALVSFAFYLLFAATVSLGRMVFVAQVAQDVARFMARELSLRPLPAVMGFNEALETPLVKSKVYDRDWLVIDLDMVGQSGVSLDEYFANAPVVNQAMRPLMIFDNPNVGGLTRRLLRFPGALITSATSPTGLTVAIPHVEYSNGQETLRWMEVVEEVGGSPDSPYRSPFNVVSQYNGLVALRINVPFQSASMTQWVRDPATPFDVDAPDSLIVEGNTVLADLPEGGSPVSSDSPGAYGGTYGLGRMYAFGQQVRPFRRVIAAQAFFRREVFGEPTVPQPVDPNSHDPLDPSSNDPGGGDGPFDPHDPMDPDPWIPGGGGGHPFDPHSPGDPNPWTPGGGPNPPFDPHNSAGSAHN